MTLSSNYKMPKDQIIFWAFLICITLTSLYINWFKASYSDLAWLLHGARIIFEGGNFVDHFYETNPPYNTVFYIPAILIQDLTGLNIHHAAMLYLVPLNSVLVTLILINLRHYSVFYEDRTTYLMMSVLFMYFALCISSEQIGQRDVFAGLGALLATSVIMKYSLQTAFTPYERTFLNSVSIILGTLMILLKPHWGLFIIASFAIRAYRQKRASVILDHDFVLVSLLTSAYIFISFMLFPRFFTDVLPHVFNIYVIKSFNVGTGISIAHVFITIITSIGVYFIAKDLKLSRLHSQQITILSLLSFFCLFPALIQNKGFAYHFFPFYYLITVCISLLFYHFLQAVIKKHALSNLYLIIPIAFILLCGLISIHDDLPRPEQYKQTALFKAIQKHSSPDDHYFIFKQNMGYVFPVNQLIDRQYGSRFASFWFLGSIDPKNPTKDELKTNTYFSSLVAEDMMKMQPKVIALQHYYLNEEDSEPFDIISYFNVNADFVSEWKKYKLEETVTFERDKRLYFLAEDIHGSKDVSFDIYVRQ